MSSPAIRISGTVAAVGWAGDIAMWLMQPGGRADISFVFLSVIAATATNAWLLFWLVPDVVRAYGLGFRDGHTAGERMDRGARRGLRSVE